MIDLHCHILPGIDDGAPDMATALAMARIAYADGIRTIACTPHIYPGLYENTAASIRASITGLRKALEQEGIELTLVEGADVHLAPNLVDGLRSDRIPSLNGSRYFLLEPPHHVAPPRFEEQVFLLLSAGYVPIITHPERLTWIESHYAMFPRLASRGAWLQLTAGALTGRFGKRPKYWSERLLEEGPVQIVATDAHRADNRPPRLAEGREAVARRLGDEAAQAMVQDRPSAVLANQDAARCAASLPAATAPVGLFKRIWSRWRAPDQRV